MKTLELSMLVCSSLLLSVACASNQLSSKNEALSDRGASRGVAGASIVPDRGTFLIEKMAPPGNPIFRTIQFGVGKMSDGETNCGTLQNGVMSDEFLHAGYPEGGSVIVMNNTGKEPLLIYSFINEADANGGNDHFSNPVVAPTVARPAPGALQQFSQPQAVIQLNSGESAAMVLSAPVPRSSGLDTDLQFSCKTLSSFASTPKFSYGTQFEFNSSF